MKKEYKQIKWTPENVARFWDYESQFPQNYFTYQFGATMVEKLKKYLKKGMNVLDYGCGTGFLIPNLIAKGLNVTAADLSAASVEAANKNFKDKASFAGAFTLDELLKSPKTFDVIFAIEVIEHLDDIALNKVIADVKQLLSSGGIVIFTTPNNEDLNASLVYCPECDRVFHRWQHVRNWSKDSLVKFMNEKGFEVKTAYATDFSASLKRNKLNLLKHFVKKIIKHKSAYPHLVCICSKKL